MRPCLWNLVVMSLSIADRTSVAAEERFTIQVSRDIEFAKVDGHSLKLDLYRPEGATSPPLIVWVHGGAWRAGSKNSMPLGELVKRGYAIASVDYRLSPVAKFPAQVHDCKAAIRFLRARRNNTTSTRRESESPDHPRADILSLKSVSRTDIRNWKERSARTSTNRRRCRRLSTITVRRIS